MRMSVKAVVAACGGRKQIAKDLRISPKTVTAWSCGGKIPAKRAFQISAIYGIDIEQLKPLT